jgi:hypothetical protein
MRRREFLKYTAATAVAAPFVRGARADSGVVKVGVVGAKTGPLGPGAAVTPLSAARSVVRHRSGTSSNQEISWLVRVPTIDYYFCQGRD